MKRSAWLLWAGYVAVFYFVTVTFVYRFKNPNMTGTERLLHLYDAVTMNWDEPGVQSK